MGLTVTGVRDVTKMLRELQKRQRTLRPFLTTEATILRDLIEKNWAARKGFDGKAWAPYDDSARTGGRLRGAERIRASKKRLETRATFIAAFHYFGTEFMPARNPLPFTRIIGGWLFDEGWGDAHGARLKAYVLGESDGR